MNLKPLDSERLKKPIEGAIKAAAAWNKDGTTATNRDIVSAIHTNTAALLEIARQIAITREETPRDYSGGRPA